MTGIRGQNRRILIDLADAARACERATGPAKPVAAIFCVFSKGKPPIEYGHFRPVRARDATKLTDLSRLRNWTRHARKDTARMRSMSTRSSSRRRAQHRLRAGAHRADRRPGADRVLHHPASVLIVGAVFGIQRIKIDDSLSQLFRSNTQEFRQYEEVTKKFPAEEFDVLVVVEGKNPAGARQSREAARLRHRPAAGRGHARPGLAVLGAAGAGAGQVAGGAVPGGTARRRGLRQVHRDRQIQRDHPRQAVVGGRHAGADRAVARSRGGRLQQARPRPSARSAS